MVEDIVFDFDDKEFGAYVRPSEGRSVIHITGVQQWAKLRPVDRIRMLHQVFGHESLHRGIQGLERYGEEHYALNAINKAIDDFAFYDIAEIVPPQRIFKNFHYPEFRRALR